MSTLFIIAVLKYGSYTSIGYAILRLANAINNYGKQEPEPELKEIIQKPRIRR